MKKKTNVSITITTNEAKKIHQALVEADSVIRSVSIGCTLVSLSKAIELLTNKTAQDKK